MLEIIQAQVREAINELLERADLKAGDVLVVGTSTSEIMGEHIGKSSNKEVGHVVISTILEILNAKHILPFY